LSTDLASLSGNDVRRAPLGVTFPGLAPLRSPLLPDAIRIEAVARAQSRPFHISSRAYQQETAEKTAGKPADKTESETKEKETETETENAEAKAKSEEAKEEESGEKKSEEGGEKQEKKEDLPPPPPHGDKTPWQVFLDTMQSEFKASKEWNESTKALAEGAHQFTESESVRKARQAYESTTGAVSSTAGKVLKTTAGAVGKGAAWTWETPVVKGVRTAANATGEVLDKATKPIRETETFKSVKSVIDDGSSSRYGGWVEKEERKKQRELREQLEQRDGKSSEVMHEDPKYVAQRTLPFPCASF